MHAEPEKQQIEARAVPAAFRSLLEVLGRESNLLVAIDDEQWLDTASATTIGFALRRLTDTPIRWLITHRLGSSYALDIERLTESEHRTHVTIGPLTLAAIHGVIKTRLQQPLTRPLLVRLHATCDGNPLYALQLVREIQSRGSEAPIDTVPVPDGLRRLIATQIRRLPPATRSELLACAALSSPSVDVLDGAALVPAVEQEIVFVDDHGRITFGHPLYAAAVYGSTPPGSSTRAPRPARPDGRRRRRAGATSGPGRGHAERTRRPRGRGGRRLESYAWLLGGRRRAARARSPPDPAGSAEARRTADHRRCRAPRCTRATAGALGHCWRQPSPLRSIAHVVPMRYDCWPRSATTTTTFAKQVANTGTRSTWRTTPVSSSRSCSD